MCVILIASTVRPTPEMVDQCWDTNKDGGGIAWREKERGMVRWEKGLDQEAMQAHIRNLPLPFIAHFRIASIGGVSDALCHPFPVDKRTPLSLKGETKGYVLFHNGHWNSWKSELRDCVKGFSTRMPNGKWSDTRALAFLAAHYGVGYLDLIDEKTVSFGPTDLEVTGSGWAKVNEVWCSNRFWERIPHSTPHGTHYHMTPPAHYRRVDTTADTAVRVETSGDSKEDHSEVATEAQGTGEIGGSTETSTTAPTKDGVTREATPPLPPLRTHGNKVQGGDLLQLPLAEALRQFQSGNLSKTRFKKIRKAWNREWSRQEVTGEAATMTLH